MSGKAILLKIYTEFKRNIFIPTVPFEEKRIKSKDPLKAFEERGAPTVNFHARMIEGFHRKSAKCPFFQLAAANSPRRKAARI